MRRKVIGMVFPVLLVAGCGGGTEPAAAPSAPSAPAVTSVVSSTPTPTSESSSPAPSSTSTARPAPTPASSNARDCFDGECTLFLSKPTTVRLDAAKLHYSAMRVTAISTTSLSYSVNTPGGGSLAGDIGVGLGGSSFGFRGSPGIEVGLLVVDGKPALVLQPGPVTS